MNISSEQIIKFFVEERGLNLINGVANFTIKIPENKNIKKLISELKSFRLLENPKKTLIKPEKLIDFKIDYFNENGEINSSFEYNNYYLNSVYFQNIGDINSNEDLTIEINLKKYYYK